MKILIEATPGAPCTLEDCEPGLFVYDGEICFKSLDLNYWGHHSVYFCRSGKDFFDSDDIDNFFSLTIQPFTFSLSIKADDEQLPLDWADDIATSEKEKETAHKAANTTFNVPVNQVDTPSDIYRLVSLETRVTMPREKAYAVLENAIGKDFQDNLELRFMGFDTEAKLALATWLLVHC